MKDRFIPSMSCGECQFCRSDCEGEYCGPLDPFGEVPASSVIKNREKVKGDCPVLYAACVWAVSAFNPGES